MILDVQELSYQFPNGFRALDSVSFSVQKGELLVISGKNGSGKTVMLRCLKGLYRPRQGNISLDRESFGLVFQDAESQIVGQTVEKDIAFGLENLGLGKEEIAKRVRRAMETLDLLDHAQQRPRSLSGGEKRRLTIAGVLVMEPEIVALDEPFANLDYPGVIQVLEKIVMLKEQGHTIILVTHELDKVLAHADRLMLLDAGRIRAVGPCADVAHLAGECGVRIPLERIPLEEMTWLKD